MATKQKPKQERQAPRLPKGPPPIGKRMPVTVRDPLTRRVVKGK